MGVKHVLTVPGRYEEIQKICQFVADGAAESGLDETAVFHIELACDEACTNIIEHAYGGEGKGEIYISWQLKESAFTVTFQDNGRSFNPDAVPMPVLPPTPPDPTSPPEIDDVKVGGLGIHFMRQLMDDVQFHFDQQDGNTLVLVKKKMSGMNIWEESVEDNIWIVGIKRPLDQTLNSTLEQRLTTLLDEGRAKLVVDLSQTNYINSGGLRTLVTGWRKARQQQGNLVLCGLDGRLQEIFGMVGFDQLFQIYPDRLAAQQGLSQL